MKNNFEQGEAQETTFSIKANRLMTSPVLRLISEVVNPPNHEGELVYCLVPIDNDSLFASINTGTMNESHQHVYICCAGSIADWDYSIPSTGVRTFRDHEI